MLKTNAMRLLDAKKIPYKVSDFTEIGVVSGVTACDYLKLDYNGVFKTLVTVGKSGKYYVFDIPVDKELDLGKCAKSVGEKNVAMIKSKELLPLTGYIHGGCSPIGMKKFFKTTFSDKIEGLENITFSGGKVGLFITLKLSDLSKIIDYGISDITV